MTARDITLRALDVLAGADVLVAEDTRTLRHLMEIHGVALSGRPLLAFHEHNWEAVRPKLLQALSEGKSVAYASEAGTPLVADPGYQLANAAIAAGAQVLAAPGASAVLCALMVAGLPTDRFLFAGFPPTTEKARATFLAELAPQQATVILYESPKRIHRLLTAVALSHGGGRRVVLCRELTKRFEEVLRGTADEVAAMVSEREMKGEIVLLLDRAPVPVASAATLTDAQGVATIMNDEANAAPTGTIAHQTAAAGAAFSFTSAAFTDPEAGTLTYAATLADDSPLPAWLTFNPATRAFIGTPTVAEKAKAITLICMLKLNGTLMT